MFIIMLILADTGVLLGGVLQIFNTKILVNINKYFFSYLNVSLIYNISSHLFTIRCLKLK